MFRHYTEAYRALCVNILDSNVPRYFSPGDREDFLTFLADAPQGSYGVLADDAGVIVGCGGIGTRQEGTEGILTWGMIHASRHRQGWGRRLALARLSQLCQLPSIKKVTINTSHETFGFYEKLGFKTIAYTPDGYAPGLHRYDMEVAVNEAFRQRLP